MDVLCEVVAPFGTKVIEARTVSDAMIDRVPHPVDATDHVPHLVDAIDHAPQTRVSDALREVVVLDLVAKMLITCCSRPARADGEVHSPQGCLRPPKTEDRAMGDCGQSNATTEFVYHAKTRRRH